jgi:hypothetical protein
MVMWAQLRALLRPDGTAFRLRRRHGLENHNVTAFYSTGLQPGVRGDILGGVRKKDTQEPLEL